MTNNEEVRVLHGKTDVQESDAEHRTQPDERVLHATTQDTHAQAVGEVGRLQLLEERAVVNVQREGVGQVQIRKVVRERQEMVPVTLTTEVLEIVVRPLAQAGAEQTNAATPSQGQTGIGQIVIDGKPLAVGQTYEIPLTEERVQVVKQAYAINEVVVHKQTQTTTHQESVTLRREELEVLDAQGLAHITGEAVVAEQANHSDDSLRR